MIAHQSARRAARRSSVYLAIVGVLACTVPAARADDDDIVNSGGFEPPFSTVAGAGRLEGQVNPAGEGQILPPGQWQRTPGGLSAATVQSAVFAPGGGVQAVQVNRTANNDARWAVQVDHLGYPDYPNPFPPEPAQPLICISWDMRVEQTIGSPGTFGPFFGVEAYDDASGIGLLGSLGVDATTGDVLYQAAGTGVLTLTGNVVDFGEWNRFAIELNYSDDTYKVFRNSLPLGTTGFVAPGLDRFSDADIAALAAAGDAASQALMGIAYYDNFLVREGPCPPMLAPADFDEDGDVDGNDIANWRIGFGTISTAIHMDGDADADQDVDGADFLVWQRQLGATRTIAAAITSVPEPATLLLIVSGAFAMMLRRRVAVS